VYCAVLILIVRLNRHLNSTYPHPLYDIPTAAAYCARGRVVGCREHGSFTRKPVKQVGHPTIPTRGDTRAEIDSRPALPHGGGDPGTKRHRIISGNLRNIVDGGG
jgi:hypothetical protein